MEKVHFKEHFEKREGMGYELIGRDGARYFRVPFVINAFVSGG